MTRRYRQPPLVEVLCEFRFGQDEPWDWTIPGLVYGQIRNDFPNRREERGIAVRVTPDTGQIESLPGLSKMIFASNDNLSLVQVAPHFLAMNRLKPYPGWRVFKPTVLKVLRTYLEIAAPSRLERIGVRYINRMEFTEQEFELEKFFNVYPKLPVSRPLKGFLTRNELTYEEDHAILVLTMGTAANPLNSSGESTDRSPAAVMLDLDFMIDPLFVKLTHAEDALELAHQRIGEVFESCITDKARSSFGEEG